ncbi:MAG TPA: dihydrolipoamide acetyltransferase family protein [Isosphaeraceae bacterium]|nr:dihydrolipoamide acetyltransferase family protein [Isosphaeraceae bacterium]
MPIEVTMPKLSPTMETGVIAHWLVKVGDQIKEGDSLADIETDKATMPMKSYDDGTIVHLDHAAGDEVALGQRVMVLAKKGEDPQKIVESMGLGKTPAAASGAVARPNSAEESSAPSRSAGNGQQAPAVEAQPVGGRLKASPLARKVAASSQVDLGEVRGSGPGGRIVRRDIESFLQGEPKARRTPTSAPSKPPAAAATTARLSSSQPSSIAPAGQRVPHSRMRKTIASRMLQAKQAAPEIHLTIDARVDRLVSAREQLNKQLAGDGIKISLGDFVTKAVALALRLHPGLNASFEPDAIVRHGEVNIGIAVALEEGLIVPVLHNADTLGLIDIRVKSDALASAARGGTLTGEQLTGGTFTISNLWMFGTRQFDAILNLPEVGILAVGAAEKRPVVVGDQLTVGTVMTLTLTADHRAVDGAMAARFLQTVKGLLEEPVSMLL